MKARMLFLTVTIASGMLLSGCWNSRELKDLGLVMAMGIDQSPKSKEYRISLQLVNPAEISGGSMGGAGAGRALPVTIVTETGSTIFEAIRKASQKESRQAFFGHMRLIVLGETLARDGVRDIFDFFERNHEPRDTTNVLVARGNTAEQIISIITPIEKIPANSKTGKLTQSEKLWAESIKVEIDDAINMLTGEGSELLLSGVEISGNPQEGRNKSNNEHTKPPAVGQIHGIALFKDGKLKSWMDDKEARGALRIHNKLKSSIINIDCGNKKDAIGIEVKRSKTGIKVNIRDDKPIIEIKIREEGDVGEMKCPVDVSEPKEVEKLEAAWSEETRKEVLAAVQAAQREKSDIFAFGEAINRQEKKAWKKIKKDWRKELFAESQIHVSVKSFIRHTGMRTKPYSFEEKKAKK